MKKILCLLLCTLMMLGMIATANAASSLENAKSYTLGSYRTGSILEGNPSDVYKLRLQNSGEISIDLSAGIEWLYLKLYDEKGTELWSRNPKWNSTIEEMSFQATLYLCKGDYYFTVSKDGNRYGQYSFKINYTPIYESFSEVQGGSNNSTSYASVIYPGNSYIGCIAINDGLDIYRFNLSSSGKFDIHLYAEIEWIYLKLYDEKGTELWSRNPKWNSTLEEMSFQDILYLCKGDYYLSVSKDGDRYGQYTLGCTFSSANESFSEVQNGSNNKLNSSSYININQSYNGLLALNDTIDTYKINVQNSKIDFNLSSNMQWVYVKLYDSTGKEIWSKNPKWNNTTEQLNLTNTFNLENGTYYLSVSLDGSNYGAYSFYFTNGGYVTPSAPTPNPAPTPTPTPNPGPSTDVGNVIGYALRTDITAAISNHAIPSYNVAGYTYIVAEDLKYYGFSVYYDNSTRTLAVNRDMSQTWVSKYYVKPHVPSYEVGIQEHAILSTDIKTYLDNNWVPSYNINGQTIIRFDALSPYGTVTYDNSKRLIWMHLPGLN